MNRLRKIFVLGCCFLQAQAGFVWSGAPEERAPLPRDVFSQQCLILPLTTPVQPVAKPHDKAEIVHLVTEKPPKAPLLMIGRNDPSANPNETLVRVRAQLSRGDIQEAKKMLDELKSALKGKRHGTRRVPKNLSTDIESLDSKIHELKKWRDEIEYEIRRSPDQSIGLYEWFIIEFGRFDEVQRQGALVLTAAAIRARIAQDSSTEMASRSSRLLHLLLNDETISARKDLKDLGKLRCDCNQQIRRTENEATLYYAADLSLVRYDDTVGALFMADKAGPARLLEFKQKFPEQYPSVWISLMRCYEADRLKTLHFFERCQSQPATPSLLADVESIYESNLNWIDLSPNLRVHARHLMNEIRRLQRKGPYLGTYDLEMHARITVEPGQTWTVHHEHPFSVEWQGQRWVFWKERPAAPVWLYEQEKPIHRAQERVNSSNGVVRYLETTEEFTIHFNYDKVITFTNNSNANIVEVLFAGPNSDEQTSNENIISANVRYLNDQIQQFERFIVSVDPDGEMSDPSSDRSEDSLGLLKAVVSLLEGETYATALWTVLGPEHTKMDLPAPLVWLGLNAVESLVRISTIQITRPENKRPFLLKRNA